jgi:signal transduction histidine kinase
VGLEHFGLTASLEMLSAKLLREATGSLPELKLDLQSVPRLTHPQQLCFFRCCQEAMLNALRHARAKRLTVKLRQLGEEACLAITDNGVGFAVPPHFHNLVRAEHFGLAGLAERVELVGGRLSVRSESGQGTSIEVFLRLEGAAEEV